MMKATFEIGVSRVKKDGSVERGPVVELLRVESPFVADGTVILALDGHVVAVSAADLARAVTVAGGVAR